MPDPNGFLRYERQLPKRRPVPVRIQDWREVYPPAGEELIRDQATRCMDCGIPFCHEGCPLGNRIPDWNDLVRTGAWEAAADDTTPCATFGGADAAEALAAAEQADQNTIWTTGSATHNLVFRPLLPGERSTCP